jgi:hypothetical protein
LPTPLRPAGTTIGSFLVRLSHPPRQYRATADGPGRPWPGAVWRTASRRFGRNRGGAGSATAGPKCHWSAWPSESPLRTRWSAVLWALGGQGSRNRFGVMLPSPAAAKMMFPIEEARQRCVPPRVGLRAGPAQGRARS